MGWRKVIYFHLLIVRLGGIVLGDSKETVFTHGLYENSLPKINNNKTFNENIIALQKAVFIVQEYKISDV